LILAPGIHEVVDPWARPVELNVNVDGMIAAIGCRLPPPLHEPIVVEFSGGLVSVAGAVTSNAELPSPIEVALLAPQPDRSTSELVVWDDEDPSPQAFRFSNVPIGLRAICIRSGSQRIVKYVQVPRGGLTLSYELSAPAATQP
jgi:hypothetical protein